MQNNTAATVSCDIKKCNNISEIKKHVLLGPLILNLQNTEYSVVLLPRPIKYCHYTKALQFPLCSVVKGWKNDAAVCFGELGAVLLIGYRLLLSQQSYPGRTSDQAGSSCGLLPAGVWLIISAALQLGMPQPSCFPLSDISITCYNLSHQEQTEKRATPLEGRPEGCHLVTIRSF